MAYLKLMLDEKEIAHLSEDGQYLCANEGIPIAIRCLAIR